MNSAKRKKRTFNHRRVKRDLTHSIDEIAVLFGIHENSVRSWLGKGLVPIDDHRPTLVHGSDLIRFLGDKQRKRKRTCAPNEFYCCRCRKPVPAWENLVDIHFQTEKRILLKAVCPHCGTGLNRVGNRAQLPKYQNLFEVQTITDRRLRG